LTVTPSAGFGQYSTGAEVSVEYTLKEEVVEAVEAPDAWFLWHVVRVLRDELTKVNGELQEALKDPRVRIFEAGGDLLQFLVLGHCWNKGDMGLRARALR
jgi:hypothetical protein